jgi:hypothetical protein
MTFDSVMARAIFLATINLIIKRNKKVIFSAISIEQ